LIPKKFEGITFSGYAAKRYQQAFHDCFFHWLVFLEVNNTLQQDWAGMPSAKS
jgi:hypothetical protein